MALLRDVPFADYEAQAAIPGSLVALAIEDLQSYADAGAFNGPTIDGTVTAQTLFRSTFPGVTTGPFVSQFFMRDIPINGKIIDARILKPAQESFMTTWEDYVAAQNSGGQGVQGIPVVEGEEEYIHNARDLGYVAGNDYANSLPFLVGMLGAVSSPQDANTPYSIESNTELRTRTIPAINFGGSNVANMLSAVFTAERPAWYIKWIVNRYLRPEVGWGLMEAFQTGRDTEVGAVFDPQIFDTHLMGILEESGSYLLPQMFPFGSPTHPSYVAGHGIILGACVTVLKAMYDTSTPWEAMGLGPPVTSVDGTAREVYDGGDLTLGSELNKLVSNVAWGRDMSGVHYSFDDYQGAYLGEEIAIRMLREAKHGLPEPFTTWTLEKFDGTVIQV